jgi:NAD dependent epimerase/dehydratase
MTWRGTRVVVTGAGGFIGSHLAERLLALGTELTAFVRYNSRNHHGFLELLGPRKKDLRVVSGDIRDFEGVRAILPGAEVVFHLAALPGIPYSYLHPREVFEVNAAGTLNVLMAAREAACARVVIASTSEVYGTARYVPIDENHPKQPQSPYAASKAAADAMALSFHAAYRLPVTVVRPFNTYGPRQSDRALIPAIIAQALTRDEILLGNLSPTRDFTFVTDTVEGFLQVGACAAAMGEEINLGSGQEVSVGDLAKQIAALVGRPVSIRQDPERVRPASSEVARLLADNSKALRLAGWTPRVSLEEGLRRTVAWVRDRLELYEPGAYRI